jgi:hypothetical protein
MNQKNPTIERLENQIIWYDKKGNFNQRCFQGLKIAEIFVAACVPFLAGFEAYSFITGGAGVLIVIFEGLQHLFQFQYNWTSYRSTCESLKHEKYLWLAKAGPYTVAKKADKVLADRIESLISREHAKWIAGRERVVQEKK